MSSLQIRTHAQLDIQEIVDYYDGISSVITDKFLDQLYQSLDFLAEHPKNFQVKYRNTRVYYLKDFPFGIHYLERNDLVVVLAVLHTSRNPKVWKTRS
ncbi:type II toxin-antitoxin system RelE/ParE family toxin [Roseivirga sp.]|uniref:type II toxin-antitoxin system RelE/ParE family toxin n=1 Tax=Roseivirga sp. TaxID=1964215 RepID=UPI003B519006